MATPNNTPGSGPLDNLQSIQNNLFASTDLYKEMNKQAGIHSTIARNTASVTTEYNKLLKAAIEVESKIGKELVTQKTSRRLIASLQSQANKLQKDYEKTLEGLNKSQRKQIDQLVDQQAKYRDFSKQLNAIDSELIDYAEQREMLYKNGLEYEAKGLQNTKEYITLYKQLDDLSVHIESVEQKRLGLQTESEKYAHSIAAAYKNQSISTAVLQGEQAKAAKDTLKYAKSFPEEIKKGNKALYNGKFLTEAISRIPFLDNFKKLPKHMEDFGVAGGIALIAVTAIAAAITEIGKLMFRANTQITDIQKGFSMSQEHAKDLRQSFYDISANASKFADIQGGTLLSQQDIYNAQLEFNKAFGTAIVMSSQQLVQLTAVKDLIGLSEEGMKGLMTYSLGSGKAIQNIDRTVLGTSRILQAQTGVQLNNKEILEQVYKTSGGIRANFRGNVAELAKVVTQAKLYGTTLEQVQKTSDSLLDFETSIESQLEAELLTGRQINMERARAAALNGDMATVMSEMVKQAGDFDHFMHYNVIQQNSLAKAFGYTRDEMSDMLFQQKAIEGLRKAGNNEEKRSLSERYQQLVKEGHSREELEQILGKDVEQRLETQSAQERFNKVVQRFEDIIGRLFDGGLLDKFVKYIAGIAEHLSSGGSIFGVLTNSSAYQAAQSKVDGEMGSVKDGVISPKGAIMISTPKGQIATDPGDSIIATTNPSGVLGGSGGSGGNMRGVESKLDQVISLLSKGGNVYIDGKKAGTALALGYNATL